IEKHETRSSQPAISVIYNNIIHQVFMLMQDTPNPNGTRLLTIIQTQLNPIHKTSFMTKTIASNQILLTLEAEHHSTYVPTSRNPTSARSRHWGPSQRRRPRR
ncbi:hypothetical protein TorRG33x02_091460, partial [Trema orientale]